jgi:endonuclease-3
MKYPLFNSLNKFYGKVRPWTEVVEVYKEEGMKMDDSDFDDPFKNLIITILSQNTSDRNSTRAYINLKRKFKIVPKILAKANLNSIKSAIKSGGLYNIKAHRIKEFSQLVLDEFDGDLKPLTRLPPKELRKRLLKIKGIGEKTADVFIAYCANHDTIVIDTNVKRVAKRLGLVGSKAKYEEIQKALEKVFPKGKWARGHELMIRLGRDICKARNPKHEKCPLNELCPKIL